MISSWFCWLWQLVLTTVATVAMVMVWLIVGCFLFPKDIPRHALVDNGWFMVASLFVVLRWWLAVPESTSWHFDLPLILFLRQSASSLKNYLNGSYNNI